MKLFRAIAILAISALTIANPLRLKAQTPPAAQTEPEETETGCLRGYPNNTFRGDRPVTRYEFAAGLESCLDSIEALLENEDLATQEDLDALIQRQQELLNELDALDEQVDQL